MLRPAAVLACAACSLLAVTYSSTGQAAIKDTCPNIRELPKEKKVEALLTCIEKLAETVEELSQGLPKDAIVAFPFEKPDDVIPGSEADDPCPKGWKRYRDADGRMIVGTGRRAGASEKFIYSFRDTGGEEEVTLKDKHMPAHSHETTVAANSTTIDYYGKTKKKYDAGVPYSTRKHLREVTEEVGGDEAHNNMPPYIALYFCKKK